MLCYAVHNDKCNAKIYVVACQCSNRVFTTLSLPCAHSSEKLISLKHRCGSFLKINRHSSGQDKDSYEMNCGTTAGQILKHDIEDSFYGDVSAFAYTCPIQISSIQSNLMSCLYIVLSQSRIQLPYIRLQTVSLLRPVSAISSHLCSLFCHLHPLWDFLLSISWPWSSPF